ncbi:MAG: hypothetical protein HKN94_04340 [Acidimicrobiales bacterium]|nr:hypothetical protein [Acidimicrobiales bacterium]NND13652.1 hypothetical protein [Acidimicrobiia bacterium]RZV44896.1 MAG: hypothetical protein EX269_10985 [Acidimicrobiales bacterium]
MPTTVADPASLLDFYDGDPNDWVGIPVPDDLQEWVDQLPVVATRNEIEVDGISTTKWVLEYDAAAPGSSAFLVAAPSGEGGFGVTLTEPLHIWHVQHPERPIFLMEVVFDDPGYEPQTGFLIESLSFPE